jgi:hypothetical protein
MDDIFCKCGRYILDCLAEEKPLEEILKGIPSGKIRKKKDEIRAELENDLNLIMSIPGIGFTSAAAILSEMGDYRDFQTPDQLAKWCGLIPGENESAGKKKKCGITKKGSKHIRVMLVQAAQTISNMNKTALSRFFKRLAKKKERNVAIIAVARKLICLIYHLLINQELYQEGECRKRGSSHDKSCHAPSLQEEQLTDKVAAIVDAFYHLDESRRKKALMRELGDIAMANPGKKRPSGGGE